MASRTFMKNLSSVALRANRRRRSAFPRPAAKNRTQQSNGSNCVNTAARRGTRNRSFEYVRNTRHAESAYMKLREPVGVFCAGPTDADDKCKSQNGVRPCC